MSSKLWYGLASCTFQRLRQDIIEITSKIRHELIIIYEYESELIGTLKNLAVHFQDSITREQIRLMSGFDVESNSTISVLGNRANSRGGLDVE